MNKNLHPIFAKRIQQVLDENGWSMADLSRRVMLSHTSVRKWASGTSVASGERLKRLSAVTGRPEYWFFMEPGDESEGERAEPKPRVLDEKKKHCFLFSINSRKQRNCVLSSIQKQSSKRWIC
ncbi:hypothetical protein I654_06835 [Salmonella enterica subsp. enterica serovar Aqua str. NVSL2001]|nr:hypothetical protein I654_06835 [Salmonella enterica subsp. enterica serovar Aqua str. NVSL2001]